MEIEPLELTVIVEEAGKIDITHDEESGISTATQFSGDTDTRKHTFFEVDNFGEWIEDDMDISIIHSRGIEFRCIHTYEELKKLIKKLK